MIQPASPRIKRAPLSANSQFDERIGLASNQCNPNASSRYDFIGTTIPQWPADHLRKQLDTNSSFNPNPTNPDLSIPLWKVVLDGFLAFSLMAIDFGIFGCMIYAYTLEIATLGESDTLEFIRQFVWAAV